MVIGIEAIISSSTDYDELTYVWTAWRDASGAKMRNLYKTYVQLANEAAVANGRMVQTFHTNFIIAIFCRLQGSWSFMEK